MKKMKFMPFYVAGYPSNQTSIFIMEKLLKYADILEVGIPNSDPLADGRTIQSAYEVAIRNGFCTKDVFDIIQTANKKYRKPIAILCYFNTVLQYGMEKFCQECQKSGVFQLVIPDLPPEHRNILQPHLNTYGISQVFIISTNTPDERIKMIDKISNSFIYFVSSPGITGAKDGIASMTLEKLKHAKKLCKNAIFIGFGISNKEQIIKLRDSGVDGFIIGSKIIQTKPENLDEYLTHILDL